LIQAGNIFVDYEFVFSNPGVAEEISSRVDEVVEQEIEPGAAAAVAQVRIANPGALANQEPRSFVPTTDVFTDSTPPMKLLQAAKNYVLQRASASVYNILEDGEEKLLPTIMSTVQTFKGYFLLGVPQLSL